MYLLQSLYKSFKSTPTFLQRLKFHTTAQPRRKQTLHSLPNELLLEIFSFLELKPYIICHGVCKKWRELLPSTEMDPVRGRFFDLYHIILNTPNFEKAFEWTDQNLQPFDREEYIRCLLSQYPAIPDEFSMWILEWPARLAIQCVWPALPFVYCKDPCSVTRREGLNWIAYRSFSPQLFALVYKKDTPSRPLVPALLLWRYAGTADWLCFDQHEPDLFGRVFRNDGLDHPLGSLPFLPPLEDDESYDSDIMTFEDWIEYLHFMWDYNCDKFEYTSATYRDPNVPISLPVLLSPDNRAIHTLPAPPWNS